ncbi:hypothetical protein CJ030_MR8G020272 [Morella rubra]|uniref:Protein NIM1-INTERACTING 1 n=1 Tax=Morella rubra TaxID=262757 RepID=A0A6A1UQR1_9ROSI|nr:hypothetical protein CJ030_MR8G020272 [Morella rubra]
MEGPASKKRKFCPDPDTEEDDEQKMEKFFALIRKIREARERLLRSGSDITKAMETEHTKNRKVEAGQKQIEVWKPSFEREDFMKERGTSLAGSPQKEEGTPMKEVMDHEEGLDLKLSLGSTVTKKEEEPKTSSCRCQ